MNITQVKVFPVPEEEKLKAFVSIVFDHCFMINDIKIIQGKDGLFLSMPSRRKKDGEFKDVAHPLNNETRRRIEEKVLSEYRAMVDDPTPRRPDRLESEETPGGNGAVDTPKFAPDAHSAPGAMPAPNPVSEPLAAAPAAASVEPVTEKNEKTLEEIQDFHLRDSFWSVS